MLKTLGVPHNYEMWVDPTHALSHQRAWKARINFWRERAQHGKLVYKYIHIPTVFVRGGNSVIMKIWRESERECKYIEVHMVLVWGGNSSYYKLLERERDRGRRDSAARNMSII